MAKTTNPLLSKTAKGRVGHLLVFYDKDKVRGWSEQVDPKTAAQLQSRTIVKEVMQMFGNCAGLDRAWLRENYSKAWHTKFTAYLTRSQLQKAIELHSTWSSWSSGERASWEAESPG